MDRDWEGIGIHFGIMIGVQTEIEEGTRLA